MGNVRVTCWKAVCVGGCLRINKVSCIMYQRAEQMTRRKRIVILNTAAEPGSQNIELCGPMKTSK